MPEQLAPGPLMRAAAARLRDPLRCNTDTRVDLAVAAWLDQAAVDAEEIGPDPHAVQTAAAVLAHPAPDPDAVHAFTSRGTTLCGAPGDWRDGLGRTVTCGPCITVRAAWESDARPPEREVPPDADA